METPSIYFLNSSYQAKRKHILVGDKTIWIDMASFTYKQGLGEILKNYEADIDEGLVSVICAIGESTGEIGQHLK